MNKSKGEIKIESTDPFDPEKLRLSQDFVGAASVKKILTTINVRKPSKEWFVRVHPEEGYRIQTAVIELKEDDREMYLLSPELRSELSGESTLGYRELITTINRQNQTFLWPIRVDGKDGRSDKWSLSSRIAADRARHSWVRIAANMSAGYYDVFEASAEWNEPIWPDVSFKELLRLAFKERYIDSYNHPVLKRLRGED